MIIQPLIENVFVHAFSSAINNPILEVNIYVKVPVDDANTLYIDVIQSFLSFIPRNLNKKIRNKLWKFYGQVRVDSQRVSECEFSAMMRI